MDSNQEINKENALHGQTTSDAAPGSDGHRQQTTHLYHQTINHSLNVLNSPFQPPTEQGLRTSYSNRSSTSNRPRQRRVQIPSDLDDGDVDVHFQSSGLPLAPTAEFHTREAIYRQNHPHPRVVMPDLNVPNWMTLRPVIQYEPQPASLDPDEPMQSIEVEDGSLPGNASEVPGTDSRIHHRRSLSGSTLGEKPEQGQFPSRNITVHADGSTSLTMTRKPRTRAKRENNGKKTLVADDDEENDNCYDETQSKRPRQDREVLRPAFRSRMSGSSDSSSPTQSSSSLSDISDQGLENLENDVQANFNNENVTIGDPQDGTNAIVHNGQAIPPTSGLSTADLTTDSVVNPSSAGATNFAAQESEPVTQDPFRDNESPVFDVEALHRLLDERMGPRITGSPALPVFGRPAPENTVSINNRGSNPSNVILPLTSGHGAQDQPQGVSHQLSLLPVNCFVGTQSSKPQPQQHGAGGGQRFSQQSSQRGFEMFSVENLNRIIQANAQNPSGSTGQLISGVAPPTQAPSATQGGSSVDDQAAPPGPARRQPRKQHRYSAAILKNPALFPPPVSQEDLPHGMFQPPPFTNSVGTRVVDYYMKREHGGRPRKPIQDERPEVIAARKVNMESKRASRDREQAIKDRDRARSMMRDQLLSRGARGFRNWLRNTPVAPGPSASRNSLGCYVDRRNVAAMQEAQIATGQYAGTADGSAVPVSYVSHGGFLLGGYLGPPRGRYTSPYPPLSADPAVARAPVDKDINSRADRNSRDDDDEHDEEDL